MENVENKKNEPKRLTVAQALLWTLSAISGQVLAAVCVLLLYNIFFLFTAVCLQRPHGIKDCDDCNSDIGKNRFPHIGHSKCAQNQHERLHRESKYNILADNPNGLSGNRRNLRDFGRIIIHQDNVRRLNGRI